MKTYKIVLLGFLFLFIAVGIVYPNPYGNNPDEIADESYFLSSSLSAIQKMTLPGWEFSSSGSYYGGIQTYIDTAVLVPVVVAMLVSQHFSFTATKVWVALHTGELLHVLHIVNGCLALLALIFCYWYFSKKKIPKNLGYILTLFLFLLLSNVLIIQFFHTAKMWDLYIILTAVSSAFFIAYEYYREQGIQPFIKKDRYIGLLVWSSALLFFQSYVGMISTVLLMIYGYFLNHFSIADVWNYIKKYWYLFIALTLTQISFLYRAIFINFADGSFSNISVKTADNKIDWIPRLYLPLRYTIESQPLAVIFIIIALCGIGFYRWKKKTSSTNSQKKKYLLIAAIHPLIVYILFHVIIGFSLAPRYGIMLTMACAFSAAILLGLLNMKSVKIGLALSFILFVIINIHAITLYWHQSSETDLLNILMTRYNSSNNIFVEDPSALRLTLPINNQSLNFLDEKRQDMSRFQFLLQQRSLVDKNTSFQPLVVLTYSNQENETDISNLKTTGRPIWTISTDCSSMCTVSEKQTGTCFVVYPSGCAMYSQEINTLPTFLDSEQLGNAYIIRKVQ